MNTTVPSAVAKVITILFLVFVGYAGVQMWQARLEAQEPWRTDDAFKLPANMDAIDAAVKAEQLKPRFSGEIGNMFIAPSDETVPDGYVTFEDICGTQYGHSVPFEEAGELNLELDLPKKYVLVEDDPNTDTVACGDIVFISRHTYSVGNGQVIVGRSRFTGVGQSIAKDRPRLAYIEGRDVILVEPLTKDGTFQNSYAWFPETFGDTFIHGAGLSQKDFMELVTLVASSTR